MTPMRERAAKAIWESWRETPTFKIEWDGISWDTIVSQRETNRAARAIYDTAFIEADAVISALYPNPTRAALEECVRAMRGLGKIVKPFMKMPPTVTYEEWAAAHDKFEAALANAKSVLAGEQL